jgi:hypothetical protein
MVLSPGPEVAAVGMVAREVTLARAEMAEVAVAARGELSW